MTITLPDEMREELELEAKAEGFASVDDYVLDRLLRGITEDAADFPNVSLSKLTPRNRAELEAMLDEGMNSGPPIRVTPEFWEDMRRQLEERMAKRKGRPS